MARGHTQAVNASRTSAAYTAAATDADATAKTNMAAAGLCGALSGGEPTDDTTRHLVGVTNLSTTILVYAYHTGVAADAIAKGIPIPCATSATQPGREIPFTDKTPIYLIAASSTAECRVRRQGD